jgi:hypothetical protein
MELKSMIMASSNVSSRLTAWEETDIVYKIIFSYRRKFQEKDFSPSYFYLLQNDNSLFFDGRIIWQNDNEMK